MIRFLVPGRPTSLRPPLDHGLEEPLELPEQPFLVDVHGDLSDVQIALVVARRVLVAFRVGRVLAADARRTSGGSLETAAAGRARTGFLIRR